MLRRMLGRSTSGSWFGMQVPAAARLARQSELAELITYARQAGFSRTARGISPVASEEYVLVPYLFEGTPAPAWICLVIGVPAGLPSELIGRPALSFARLDISLRDFKRLRRLRRRESDQLFHWVVWMASRGAV